MNRAAHVLRHGVAATLAVTVAATGLAGCSSGGPTGDWVLEVDGVVSVRDLDGGRVTWREGRHEVTRGSRVAVSDGSAVLDLPGAAELELRAGRDGGRDADLRVAAVPELLAGDALAVARSSSLRLRAGSATVRLDRGAARVRRGTGATLAVYGGRAELDVNGRSSMVPALRQLTVTDSGAVPNRPSPLAYRDDRTDPWDRRYLGDAIDLGRQLERRSRALTANATDALASVEGVLRQLPELERQPGWMPQLVPGDRSLGEVVVGASIALSAGEAGSGFEQRWAATFAFRNEGARWGLVAADRGASRGPLLRRLDLVLEQNPLRLVSGGASRPGPILATVAPGPSASPGTGAPTPPTTAPSAPPPGPEVTPPTVATPPTVVPSELLPGLTTTTAPRSGSSLTLTTTVALPTTTVPPVTLPTTTAPLPTPTTTPTTAPTLTGIIDSLLRGRGTGIGLGRLFGDRPEADGDDGPEQGS